MGMGNQSIPTILEGIVPRTSLPENSLVVIHPVKWVSLHYALYSKHLSLKYWMLSSPPPVQTKNYEGEVIRVEWFEQDLAELGIKTKPIEKTIFIPNMCLSTRALIRRIYHQDYIKGDYE